MYRHLGGLKNSIQHATQQLEVLNRFTVQTQRAIIALINLQNMGVSEAEIVELVNFVGKSGKQWLGMAQVNVTSNNGKSGDGNKAWKLDDKLNIGRQAISNIVSYRVEPPTSTRLIG